MSLFNKVRIDETDFGELYIRIKLSQEGDITNGNMSFLFNYSENMLNSSKQLEQLYIPLFIPFEFLKKFLKKPLYSKENQKLFTDKRLLKDYLENTGKKLFKDPNFFKRMLLEEYQAKYKDKIKSLDSHKNDMKIIDNIKNQNLSESDKKILEEKQKKMKRWNIAKGIINFASHLNDSKKLYEDIFKTNSINILHKVFFPLKSPFFIKGHKFIIKAIEPPFMNIKIKNFQDGKKDNNPLLKEQKIRQLRIEYANILGSEYKKELQKAYNLDNNTTSNNIDYQVNRYIQDRLRYLEISNKNSEIHEEFYEWIEKRVKKINFDYRNKKSKYKYKFDVNNPRKGIVLVEGLNSYERRAYESMLEKKNDKNVVSKNFNPRETTLQFLLKFGYRDVYSNIDNYCKTKKRDIDSFILNEIKHSNYWNIHKYPGFYRYVKTNLEPNTFKLTINTLERYIKPTKKNIKKVGGNYSSKKTLKLK